jgi:hypothetical protein
VRAAPPPLGRGADRPTHACRAQAPGSASQRGNVSFKHGVRTTGPAELVAGAGLRQIDAHKRGRAGAMAAAAAASPMRRGHRGGGGGGGSGRRRRRRRRQQQQCGGAAAAATVARRGGAGMTIGRARPNCHRPYSRPPQTTSPRTTSTAVGSDGSGHSRRPRLPVESANNQPPQW